EHEHAGDRSEACETVPACGSCSGGRARRVSLPLLLDRDIERDYDAPVEAEDEKRPIRSVPNADQRHRNDMGLVLAGPAAAAHIANRERKVQIVLEPPRQTDVPALPELDGSTRNV